MPAYTLDINNDWDIIVSVFKRAQNTGLCHHFSTVNEDGTPNITPIGSLVLNLGSPGGYYFDVFNRTLSENLDRNPNVAILAVDSRKLFWLKSVFARKFKTPPAIRLIGKVGSRRPALAEEITRSLQEIQPLKRLGASKKLGKGLKNLRQIEFTRVDVLNIGAMTNKPWRES